jgi:DMSO/TMAO reductase YedYZ heme-binding membrane subunit
MSAIVTMLFDWIATAFNIFLLLGFIAFIVALILKVTTRNEQQ